MVDFTKKLQEKESSKPHHPLEIYNTLDRSSETGPLRTAQEEVLNNWFDNRRNEKNQIIKLHTGQGKTLIGLLILASRLNSGETPCLYVCPNIYLVQQTIKEAQKFGIPHCFIKNELPEEFLNGEKILITHVQKVFNGKTIFGLDNKSVEVHSIILDDSHACIDTISDSGTIKIYRNNQLFEKLIELFEEELKEQGEGSFLDIMHSKYDSLLPIPYWAWINKKSEVLQLLSEVESDDDSIKFVWPILKDKIENYQAIVSGLGIEIKPYHFPIHKFGTFHNAEQRVLMSATTQDDSFFIKGLEIDKNSILNPLRYSTETWSGEKMMLLPSLIHPSLDREAIIKTFSRASKNNFGTVTLVPSFNRARDHESNGSIILKKQNIFEEINNLKNGDFENPRVIVNRYDGIDLPDSACRILILDSKPYFNSLSDRYQETCRKNSNIIAVKYAQKIEQGLGRSVRGEKDYSTIIITGGDLLKFTKSFRTKQYFSQQTNRQIEIGLEIAEAAKEDLEKETPIKVLISLINQSLGRDSGWKQYYVQRMNEIKSKGEKKSTILDIMEIEALAEKYHFNNNSERAITEIQRLINEICTEEEEKGWYLQKLARYQLSLSKADSIETQKAAYKRNYQLLLPLGGVIYKKIEYIEEDRIRRILDWIKTSPNFKELILNVESICAELTFGMKAEKFENAMDELGKALGLKTQRPDKEFKKGPDNLWCGASKEYLMFECKSEVGDKRQEITKTEAGQMNSHAAWFEENYHDSKVTRIMIIPTTNLSYSANFAYDVKIMRKNRLKLLRDSFRKFYMEFRKYDLNDISEEKVNELLTVHKLQIKDLTSLYHEDYYHRKK